MANAEQIEKMQVVVDSLRANPDVVVVGGHEDTYLSTGDWPNPHGYWSRTLDIFTHPKEPMYKADELNDFMLGLVTELKPTTLDRFSGGERRDRALRLGKLYYDEKIGTAALSATVQLKEGLSVVRNGILTPGWTSSKELDLRQRTWVNVYPDAGHLADAAEGRNQYEIPMDELGRHGGASYVVASLFEARMFGRMVEPVQPVIEIS